MNDLKIVRRRKAAAIATAAAMSSTAAAAVWAPGAEAGSPSYCPKHYFCTWTDSGFNGYEDNFNFDVSNYKDYAINDTTSSVYNNTTSHWVKLYNNANGSGYLLCVAPGAAESFLGNWKKDINAPIGRYNNWNDAISSHYLRTYQPSDCKNNITAKGCSL